jgi:hypothetical protein
MNFMKKKILLGVLAVVIIAVAIGYRMYSKQTPDIVQDEPAASLLATELIAAFEKDSARARQQYIDKVIEVKGNIKSVDTSGAVVMGEADATSEVVIGLDRRYLQDVHQLTVGSTAVLQGVCSGYSIAGADPDDLLASLGTTIQLRSAGIKKKP